MSLTDKWFLLPIIESEDIDGNIERYPKYSDGFSYSGNIIQVDGSQKYIVRCFADESTLEEIAEKDDVQDLTDVEIENHLNDKFNADYDLEEWNNRFNAG